MQCITNRCYEYEDVQWLLGKKIYKGHEKLPVSDCLVLFERVPTGALENSQEGLPTPKDKKVVPSKQYLSCLYFVPSPSQGA